MTKQNSEKSEVKSITAMAQLVARANLALKLGYQYGGDRDIYQALGYKDEPVYADFWTQYKRQDIAKAIIDRPVKRTWQGSITLIQSNDGETTPFEVAWTNLEKELKLKTRFMQLDKLVGLGRYAVLLLGFNDISEPGQFKDPVHAGKRKLLYIKPVSEDNISIDKYEENTTNERYGKPLLYSIQTSTPDGTTAAALIVHHTRVLHVIDDPLDSDIEGTPRLEVVYNRLQDLEKLVGASAEMFWRGARPGYQGKIDKDFQITADMKADLEDQLDEYENNLRRMLVNEGIDFKALETQVSNPEAHVDIQLQMISAVTGIPKRILTGSERGELASSEDSNQWASLIHARREEFAKPAIIDPFVKICMEYGILPKVSEYYVDWEDLFVLGDKEQAEVGKIRSETLKNYSDSLSQGIIPTQAFLQFFLGMDPDQIALIESMMEEMMIEDELTPEETEIIETETIEEEVE